MHHSLFLSTLLSAFVTCSPISKDKYSLDPPKEARHAIMARQRGAVRNDLFNGTVVGPPFSAALDHRLGTGKVAFQGVEYPADVPSFLQGGDPEGAATMADLVNQAASHCADTQIVMSGYSEAAQIASLVADQLSADVAGCVGAMVLFGNPNGNDPVNNIDNAGLKIFAMPAI